jgi:para-aminobenzoate synthetase
MKSLRIIIVDNYDSFTWNLFQLVAEVAGKEPIVVRNDEMSFDQLQALKPDGIILSPGPGRPERREDFGLCGEILQRYAGPVLGVCLGHQGICHAFGGKVVHAPQPMHGRLSEIRHDGSELFSGIPREFSVVRYHSLMCEQPLPPELRATAWSEDGVVMAMAHHLRPIWGVQFHPESVSTEYGAQLVKNFLLQVQKRMTEVPVHVHRLAGGLEADAVFASLFGDQPNAVWLDSAMSGRPGARFSYMAAATERALYDARRGVIMHEHDGECDQIRGDFHAWMQQRLQFARVARPEVPFAFHGGWIGYLGYEMKAAAGYASPHAASTPDSIFLYVDRFVAFDHETQDVYLVCVGEPGDWIANTLRQLAEPLPLPLPQETEQHLFHAVQRRGAYLRSIASCREELRNGESYEICLTNQLRARTTMDPLAYYGRLRQYNPAPFAAFLRFPELSVACSSPERFLSVTPEGRVEARPIKGTIRRGVSAQEDALLCEQLASDEKSRAENLMIADLLRNDLGQVCRPGSVRASALMQVETYTTVHQLVSVIEGELQKGQTALDALRAAFPGGSMTGAPKRRTMEIIDQLEPEARGVYSGCIGYLSVNGAADFNIVIRSAVFQQGAVSIGVGGAIIALSDPEEEWREILLKAHATLRAFGAYTLDCEEPAQTPAHNEDHAYAGRS